MLVNNLVNGNIYIDGGSWFGTFSECQLPDIQHVFEEHVSLGQNAKVELIVGMDLFKAMLKLNAPYAALEKLFADGYTNHKLQLRGNLETYTGSTRTGQNAYVCHFHGSFRKKTGGTIKSKAQTEIETEVNVTYAKLTIAGEPNPIYEIDVMNNIYNVDGVDILAQYRANLGI